MRHVLYTVVFLAVAGCSMVGERGPGPKVIDNKPQFGGCEFAEFEHYNEFRDVPVEVVYQTIDCVREKLDSAFGQIKGNRPGEISVSELRTLYRTGLLKITKLKEYDSDELWDWFGLVVGTFHPQGHPAINQAAAHQILATLRKQVPLSRDWIEAGRKADIPPPKFAELFKRTVHAADEFTGLFSAEWSLSLGRVRQLVTNSEPLFRKAGLLRGFEGAQEQLDVIEAAWILKSTVLADPLGQGPRADLRLAEMRRLIKTGLDVALILSDTQNWIAGRMAPAKIPATLPVEWNAAARVFQEYFLSQNFASIDSEILAWALKRLKIRDVPSQLASDVVRLSQRLHPHGQRGLHPLSFVPLLGQAKQIAENLVAAAPLFPADCNDHDLGSRHCVITLRQAAASPVLKPIALKGRTYSYLNEWALRPLEKPLDLLLSQGEIASRFTKLAMVEKIFDTFDTERLGKLPLKGLYQEDLKDTLDLTYTFLRFLSVGEGKPKKDGAVEEAVPSIMTVRPSSLYGLMGLLGDRWMPDGNRDNALNAQELFSVVQFYDEHAGVAARLASGFEGPTYIPEAYATDRWGSPYRVADRTHFVRSLFPKFLLMERKYATFFNDVDPQVMDSLSHGLVSTAPRKPFVGIEISGSSFDKPALVKVENYVEFSESQAPAAVLVAMDKLDLACDKNEDLKYDWNELDCVTPLVLDAGYHVVTSALVDMDPGVYDLSRVMLKFLQRPGIPVSLAKFVLISGSFIKPFKGLMKEIEEWLKPKAHLDWLQLGGWAYSFSRQLPMTQEQLIEFGKKQFTVCDIEALDGELKGSKEMDCATNLAIKQATEAAGDVLGGDVPKSAVDNFLVLVQTQVMRMAIQFGLQRPEVIATLLGSMPLHSSKGKILEILEELIRRGQPLPPAKPKNP